MDVKETNESSAHVPEPAGLDFIRRIIEEDQRTGKWGGRVATRFPPEPNGYLHIGHAKSICLNFGIAEEYGGVYNLRYDDTNPEKEEVEYVKAIEADVRWLGFNPTEVIFASDYFDTMYEYAVELIKKGKAYVDDQSPEEIRKTRGTATTAGDGESVSRPISRGEPRSVRSNAQGRISRRNQGAAGEDRHVVAEFQSARSGDVSHPARSTPQHGQEVVHLSYV